MEPHSEPSSISMLPDGYRYWAFLSYSHSDNREVGRKWADWLHESLETYRLPEALVGKTGRMGFPVPERIFPLFQDEKELPTHSALGEALETALRESLFLIVLCSPRSTRSLWVNEEILKFKQMGRGDRILPLIIDGEPNAAEPGKPEFTPELECFPETLRYNLASDGTLDRTSSTEPIAADIRSDDGSQPSLDDPEHGPVLDREKLRLIAGIAGVGFDSLVQRDRQREVLRALKAKADRENEARGLFEQGENAVRMMEQEAARHGTEFIFAQLGAAEDFYLRAQEKNPQLEHVGERLSDVRAMLVESGIESGDLNMATLFLSRLRQTAGERKNSSALKARLTAALESSDPRRNPGLRAADTTAFISSLLGIGWILVSFAAFAFGVSKDSRNVPLLLALVVMLPLLGALVCMRQIGHARIGIEAGHRRAVFASYFTCVTGFLTINLPLFIGYAKTLHLLSSTKNLQLAWTPEQTKHTP